jgi:hypothetical protein
MMRPEAQVYRRLVYRRVIFPGKSETMALEITAIITDSDGVVTSAGETMPIKYDAQEDTPDAAYLNLSDAVFKCLEPVTRKIHKAFYEWARDKCGKEDGWEIDK